MGTVFRVDPAGRLPLAGQANGTDDCVNEYVNACSLRQGNIEKTCCSSMNSY